MTKRAGSGPGPAGVKGLRVNPEHLDVVRARLELARSQLAGIIAAIEESQEDGEVVHQLAAVSKIVDGAAFTIIAVGMRQCLVDPGADCPDADGLEELFLRLA